MIIFKLCSLLLYYCRVISRRSPSEYEVLDCLFHPAAVASSCSMPSFLTGEPTWHSRTWSAAHPGYVLFDI